MEFSKEQAVFLVEVFKANTYGRGFKGNVYSNYLKAEMYLRGWGETNPRSCDCEYPALTRIVNSLYDQYEPQILEIYYEKESTQHLSTTNTTTKSGRKGRSIQKSK